MMFFNFNLTRRLEEFDYGERLKLGEEVMLIIIGKALKWYNVNDF